MPANQNLSWFDIDDFTAGIWDETAAAGKFAAPPKAFRTLDDYQPVKGGGLRAWLAPTSIDMSAFTAAHTIFCGIFARSGVVRATGVGGSGGDTYEIIVITLDTADLKTRIMRFDNTTLGGGTWATLYTSSAGSSALPHQNPSFSYFKDKNGVEWYIVTGGGLTDTKKIQLDYTVATGTGNDGAVTSISAHHGPNCVSQQRVFVAGGDTLFYSDVNLTTNVDTNFLAVAQNEAESDIAILSAVAPADLLVGKEGAPWVVISGDVANVSTPVREMVGTHVQRQNKQSVPRTPAGICFIESGGRIFETDGRTFKSLSDQLGNRPFHFTTGMVGPGQMAYLDDIMFAPAGDSGSSGKVYDFVAGCWFNTTYLNPVFACADQNGGFIWTLNHTVSDLRLYQYPIFEDAGASRVLTGVIQTVPYADKNGRNLDIREVQLFVNCYATTEFKVELIDETGSSIATRYATVVGARSDVVSVLFPNSKSRYLSCKITPTAASVEAPTFERIRIGFGINNLVGTTD